MKYMVDLNDFAEGALAARFNEELQKVFENIADPNTDPQKNRTITVQVEIRADEKRDVADSNVIVKSKLQPARKAETKLLMGMDDNMNIVGRELKSGIKDQMFIDSDGDLAEDTGEKVISFKDTK